MDGIVRLPKRRDPPVPLKNNRKEALQLLVGLERRLMHNATLRDQYTTFLDEYQRLGHMVSIPVAEIQCEDVYYLPHHAVFKKSGPVDKNASHRTSSGHTLNDLLLPGPKLQSELWIILTRWRLYPYAFTSDRQDVPANPGELGGHGFTAYSLATGSRTRSSGLPFSYRGLPQPRIWPCGPYCS